MIFSDYLKKQSGFESLFLEEPKLKGCRVNLKRSDVLLLNGVEILLEGIKKAIKGGQNINVLLQGTQGTGKTTFGKLLASETKKPFFYINGEQSLEQITTLLKGLPSGFILLIDEIHNLSTRLSEVLYPAIEYREFGLEGEIYKIENGTFVGTTTEIGKLPRPLRDRFIEIELLEPSIDDLKIFLKDKIKPELLEPLLKHTTNLRVINNLRETCRLLGGETIENLQKVFLIKGILPDGLTKTQHHYLEILKDGAMSLKSIASYLGRTESFIREEVEPALLKKRLIVFSSKGRSLFHNSTP